MQGDIIFGIEKCPVQDLNSWFTCLESIWEAEPLGFCLDTDRVRKYSNHSENPGKNKNNHKVSFNRTNQTCKKGNLTYYFCFEGCCAPEKDTSATHLCFMQMGVEEPYKSEKLQNRSLILDNIDSRLNSNKSGNSTNVVPSSFCLPAKPIVNVNDSVISKCIAPQYTCAPSIKLSQSASDNEVRSRHDDNVQKDEVDEENKNNNINDSKLNLEQDGQQKPEEESSYSSGVHCYLPRIVKQFEKFRIVQIHRRQEEQKESVLFVGDVRDLASGIITSEYIPRNWFLSRLFGFSTFCVLPVELETVLLLTAGLSAGKLL